MKQTRKKTTPFIPYDYEVAFDKTIDQDDDLFVRELIRKGKRAIYATKRIDAGDQVELEIYPEFVKREDIPAAARRPGYNAQAQRNLKDKNARKNCERLINQEHDQHHLEHDQHDRQHRSEYGEDCNHHDLERD